MHLGFRLPRKLGPNAEVGDPKQSEKVTIPACPWKSDVHVYR